MFELFANSGDPDQTPRSAASDLGLHCLPVTRLGVSSLQWVTSRKHTYMILTPLNPQFYIVKLGFTGVYFIFLISAQKHRLWLPVRTASTKRF